MKGYAYNGSIAVPVVSDREAHRRTLDAVRMAERDRDMDLWLAGSITREEYDARCQAGWTQMHDAMRAYLSGGSQ